MTELEQEERAEMEIVANAARAFIAVWNEFNGHPGYVADEFAELIEAAERWFKSN